MRKRKRFDFFTLFNIFAHLEKKVLKRTNETCRSARNEACYSLYKNWDSVKKSLKILYENNFEKTTVMCEASGPRKTEGLNNIYPEFIKHTDQEQEHCSWLSLIICVQTQKSRRFLKNLKS